MSNYAFHITRKGSFDAIVEDTIAALQEEGFGVLTEIDVAATLRAKLQIEHRPYRILGACNPTLAHQALEADPDIGALLPCNVVVREESNGTVSVLFMDPEAVLGLVNKPEVTALGSQVRERLLRVAETLRD